MIQYKSLNTPYNLWKIDILPPPCVTDPELHIYAQMMEKKLGLWEKEKFLAAESYMYDLWSYNETYANRLKMNANWKKNTVRTQNKSKGSCFKNRKKYYLKNFLVEKCLCFCLWKIFTTFSRSKVQTNRNHSSHKHFSNGVKASHNYIRLLFWSLQKLFHEKKMWPHNHCVVILTKLNVIEKLKLIC